VSSLSGIGSLGRTGFVLLAGLSMLCSFKSHCRKSRNRHDERDLKFRTPVTHLLMVCSEQQEGATVPPTHSPPGPASPELAAALWLSWRRSLGRAFPYSAFAAIWDHASWRCCLCQRGVYSALWPLQKNCLPCQTVCFPVTVTNSFKFLRHNFP